MKPIALMVGACILVALPRGKGEAGQCTAEIENVTKLLASHDAGSGPTAGGAASTTVGQHHPTAPMGAGGQTTWAPSPAAGRGGGQHPPTAAMNEAARGGDASTQSGGAAREQHPPTAAMGQATQGGAASPQDVQSQIRGGPTAAQQAEGARRPASEKLAAAEAPPHQARRLQP